MPGPEGLESPVLLVHHVMVEPAQQREVVLAGVATVGPVFGVVGVAHLGPDLAAREPAPTVALWEVLHGEEMPFDPTIWSAVIDDWLEHGYNPRCPHVKLGEEVFGVDRSEELSRLDVPTLVVYGTDDPMFPLDHAHALAQLLSMVALHLRPGCGHELFADRKVHQLVAGRLSSGNLLG